MGSLTNMFKPALLLSLLLAAAAKPGRGPAPRREANPLPSSSRLFSRVFSGGPGLSRKAAQPAKERQEDYPWYGSYTYDDNFYYNYNGDYTSLEEHLFEELNKCQAEPQRPGPAHRAPQRHGHRLPLPGHLLLRRLH